ncbi:MAG TPA: hypothetical protein VKH45_02425 [Candidatus Acidoferrum sp.]|nr:hypothetical protein [Candidatus Acidoferrum sp.]
MKNIFGSLVIAAACVFANPARAQTGTGALDITAQITPSGGRPEPVRQFTLCLLTKSYEQIMNEVEATDPMPTKEEFIDKLKVSDELKAWMKKHDVIDLTQIDFDKLVTPDDIMTVPEFLAAYQRSNSGGVTPGMPQPKFKQVNKDTDPDKYEKLKEEYLTSLKKFMTAHPSTINGVELELTGVSPKVKWDKLQVEHGRKISQLAPDTAQSKYLAGKADTDLDGRAVILGLKPGNYWLSSLGVDAASGDRHMHWDVATKIEAGQTTHLTLSNLNGTDANTPSR